MAKGRPKGSLNKSTLLFRERLDAVGFSIPEEAAQLYHELKDKPFLQVKLLELMANYAHPRPKPLDDEGNPEDPSAGKSMLIGIPSDVLVEALRITNERKEKA